MTSYILNPTKKCIDEWCKKSAMLKCSNENVPERIYCEDELIRNDYEVTRPNRANTRNIRSRVAQVSTDYRGKEMRERRDNTFF